MKFMVPRHLTVWYNRRDRGSTCRLSCYAPLIRILIPGHRFLDIRG